MSLIEPTDSNPIFVGVPCFNRPEGLENTIRCLQQQTHENWTALICDNASEDPSVRSVAEDACNRDPRLRYHRHAENVGPAKNFLYATLAADQPLFMWASDDDLWEPQFMATNLEHLAEFPDAHMSFCTIDAINREGHTIRTFDGFSRFQSTGCRRTDVINFLDNPEILGKANLVYGLFRTESLHACIHSCWEDAEFGSHGGDVVLLFAFLCRYAIVAHDQVHLHKRQDTLARSKERRRHPRSYKAAKASEFQSYLERHRKVASTTEFADLAEGILQRRRSERMLYRIPLLGRFVDKQRKSLPASLA